MVRGRIITLALAGALSLTGLQALADEDRSMKEQKGRDCLPISHVDRVEIVDDQTLKFHMVGKKKYINKLPYKCHGLESQGTFMHETSMQSYCDLDTISVIDTSIGMRMGSCPLGEFELWDKEKHGDKDQKD